MNELAAAVPEPRWSIVVPVKVLARAKSRLSTRPANERVDLARAFALDVVATCLATPQVALTLVVTDDEQIAELVRPQGALVLADPLQRGGLSALNAAALAGADEAMRQRADQPVAILAADLPALRPADLSLALTACSRLARAFTSDSAGLGTTMLTSGVGIRPMPRFGTRSRAAHAADGAVELTGSELSRLRCDVDTEVDLWHAVALGVGPRTAAVLDRIAARQRQRRDMADVEVQGTVRSFDSAVRGGTVILDDGTTLRFDSHAFDIGGLRLLRPGQRVRMRVEAIEGADVVTALTLATFAWADGPHA
ncbi:MAG TPA: 2-phospho-L-lactate guanylyltransferase [Candidatus Nanopelagicales bacterium]